MCYGGVLAKLWLSQAKRKVFSKPNLFSFNGENRLCVVILITLVIIGCHLSVDIFASAVTSVMQLFILTPFLYCNFTF